MALEFICSNEIFNKNKIIPRNKHINKFFFRIFNPYFENFEGTDYWMVGGKNPSWERGYPSNFAAEMPASGSNCWVTSLAGNSNSNEESYLTSPCYFVSAVQALGVRFKYAMNTSVNSGALLEYFNTMDSTWLECSDFSMPAESLPMEHLVSWPD